MAMLRCLLGIMLVVVSASKLVAGSTNNNQNTAQSQPARIVASTNRSVAPTNHPAAPTNRGPVVNMPAGHPATGATPAVQAPVITHTPTFSPSFQGVAGPTTPTTVGTVPAATSGRLQFTPTSASPQTGGTVTSPHPKAAMATPGTSTSPSSTGSQSVQTPTTGRLQFTPATAPQLSSATTISQSNIHFSPTSGPVTSSTLPPSGSSGIAHTTPMITAPAAASTVVSPPGRTSQPSTPTTTSSQLFSFSRTDNNTVQVFQSGKLILNTTPQYAAQYGYQSPTA